MAEVRNMFLTMLETTFMTKNGKLVLLDGDKIAVLLSSFLQEEILALSTAIPS